MSSFAFALLVSGSLDRQLLPEVTDVANGLQQNLKIRGRVDRLQKRPQGGQLLASGSLLTTDDWSASTAGRPRMLMTDGRTDNHSRWRLQSY